MLDDSGRLKLTASIVARQDEGPANDRLLPPALHDGERAVHLEVDITLEVVVSCIEWTQAVLGCVDPREGWLAEDLVSALIGQHCNVVRDALILIVEVDGERLSGRSDEAVCVESDALRRDV